MRITNMELIANGEEKLLQDLENILGCDEFIISVAFHNYGGGISLLGRVKKFRE